MADLIVRDLSLNFGGNQALQGVSLDVASNSFVGLIGPNGAGKTTVINCISRIYSPSQGKIEFDGQNVLDLTGDDVVRLGIARTFQDLGFFQHIANMMIIDYVRLGQFNPAEVSIWRDGLGLRSARQRERKLKARAREVLDFFRQMREHVEPPAEERQYPFLLGREGFPDLIDLEFSPVGNLSFAWRRMLDLARALASEPKLILLDEPAQGLPPSEIENLGRMLAFIQSEFKVSALIVEHNIETLMKVSNRVIAMHQGQILAEGTSEDVRNNSDVIRLYLGESKKTPDVAVVSDESAIAATPRVRGHGVSALLDVRNIDVYFGTAQALFGVSLQIFPGEVVSILGTNGSGKSTLMRTLAGVEKPSFGEIALNGELLPLGWPEVAVERGIQYVAQGHVIFPELTVQQNLRIGSYIFERRGVKFADGLERVFHYFPDLKTRLDVQAGNLSGGLQQMVAIGQAIMGRPKLLLLDEPSLGLSPELVESLFSIVRRLSVQENCAVGIVEQNVGKALEVSDHIFMMSSGVLIGEGSSESLRRSDATVKRMLGFR